MRQNPFMRGAVILGTAALIFCWLGGIVHADVIVNPNGSFANSNVTVGTDTASVEGWTFNKGGSAVASFFISFSLISKAREHAFSASSCALILLYNFPPILFSVVAT